jgi:hypothetical protein
MISTTWFWANTKEFVFVPYMTGFVALEPVDRTVYNVGTLGLT